MQERYNINRKMSLNFGLINIKTLETLSVQSLYCTTPQWRARLLDRKTRLSWEICPSVVGHFEFWSKFINSSTGLRNKHINLVNAWSLQQASSRATIIYWQLNLVKYKSKTMDIGHQIFKKHWQTMSLNFLVVFFPRLMLFVSNLACAGV